MTAKKTKKTKRKVKVGRRANTPLVLLILDGWGMAPRNKGNAIAMGNTPTMDMICKTYPHTGLRNFGKYVGLPAGQVGNSEAGHMNIGAGRIVGQDAVRISKAINHGTFFKNPAFNKALRHVEKNKSALHLIGMLSDGGSAHADQDHLDALLSLTRVRKVKKIYLHLFTDGRDSPRHAAAELTSKLEKKLGKAKISTIMGRFYAMDRKKNWKRTKTAYEALVLGKGRKAKDAEFAIVQSYNRDETDEFIPPYVIDGGKSIDSKDGIIFFNLRSDRARQLAKTFVQRDFYKMNPGSFHRPKKLSNIVFVAMTDFGPDLDDIVTAFSSEDLFDTLPMVLSDSRQLYISETEKYAHVTYFMNGGYPDPVNGEERAKVESPAVKSYDLTPRMSTGKITNQVLRRIDNYDFITINFASPDMVAHTGNIKAAIKAVEYVDKCVQKIYKAVLARNGVLLITSDHGNVDEMINIETGEILTQHSFHPSPFVYISKNTKGFRLRKSGGTLADIAPTVLELMCRKKPKAMNGKSLLTKSRLKTVCKM